MYTIFIVYFFIQYFVCWISSSSSSVCFFNIFKFMTITYTSRAWQRLPSSYFQRLQISSSIYLFLQLNSVLYLGSFEAVCLNLCFPWLVSPFLDYYYCCSLLTELILKILNRNKYQWNNKRKRKYLEFFEEEPEITVNWTIREKEEYLELFKINYKYR